MTDFYHFGFGKADGDGSMKDLLGGKGAGLAEMSKLGLPVPPGFTIPTSACIEYMVATSSEKDMILKKLAAKAEKEIAFLSAKLERPVLVSVRSGARVSMPGMMDTLLNVGLTDENLKDFKALLGDEAAEDCKKRLAEMYKSTVGLDVPSTLWGQLVGSIAAVFESWNSERAKEYRKVHGYPDDWGTAVTIQVMVYGNLNENSCSGVLFTRNPQTGACVLMGEYLPNAQGEDVVAGTHTPQGLHELPNWNLSVSTELFGWAAELEKHYKDVQDIEFTVEDGTVFILQTRSAKRSALAAFRIAYDMVQEGVIDKVTAIKRVTAKQYMALKIPVIDPAFEVSPTAVGIPASAGMVTGVAVFTNAEAKASKVPCIMVAEETTPDDFPGMVASVGVITYKGGATSHAAVVARGMDKPCIVGVGTMVVGSGDMVTMDGASGRVWVNVVVPVVGGGGNVYVDSIVGWAKEQNNVVSRRELTPPPKMPEAGWWLESLSTLLPSEGKMVLDLRGVGRGWGTKYQLSGLLGVLIKSKLTGVLSFATPVSTVPESDIEFMGFVGFGGSAMPQASVSPKEFEVYRIPVLLNGVMKGVKSRWVLEVPHGLSENAVQKLRDAGWRLVIKATTLSDVLSAEGMVSPTPELFSRVTQSEFTQVITLLVNSGKDVSLLPMVVTDEELVFEVLGK